MSAQRHPDGRKRRHRAVALTPEVRHFSADRLEVRSSKSSNEIVITGQPIVYNRPYTVHDVFGSFQETMAPGVAREALTRGADVRFLVNHEGLALARSTSGTMTFQDGPDALSFEARLDARQHMANDLAIACERGDVTQMSCGFIVGRDSWDATEDNRTVRSFSEFLDVSAVTYPASPTTSLAVAKRMALEIPVEPRARARKLYTDLRAGKTLSQSNQDRVVKATEALHEVLGDAGVDATELFAGVGAWNAQVDAGESMRGGTDAAMLRLKLESIKRRRRTDLLREAKRVIEKSRRNA